MVVDNNATEANYREILKRSRNFPGTPTPDAVIVRIAHGLTPEAYQKYLTNVFNTANYKDQSKFISALGVLHNQDSDKSVNFLKKFSVIRLSELVATTNKYAVVSATRKPMHCARGIITTATNYDNLLETQTYCVLKPATTTVGTSLP